MHENGIVQNAREGRGLKCMRMVWSEMYEKGVV